MTQANTPITAPLQSASQVIVAKLIADVTAKLGASQAKAFGPIITQYAPVFAAMTVDEVWAWIGLALNGDPYDAYKSILDKMDAAGLSDEWSKLNAKWQSANEANVAVLAMRRSLASGVVQVLATMALAMVGL